MTRPVVGLIVILGIAWGGLAASVSAGLTPRLGLDLKGGTAVVLTAPEGTDPGLIEVATQIMHRRIEDIGGVQEPDIQISGNNTVVVQLPGVEDEQRAIEAVGRTGLLSFRSVLEVIGGEIGPLAGTGTENIDDATGLTITDDIHAASWLPDQSGSVLYVGPVRLEGAHVANAVPFFDPNQAVWSVNLDLTSEGAVRFAEMTAEAASYPFGHPRRHIAIVLDGTVITFPPVSGSVSAATGITGGSAQITTGQGEEAKGEANDLAVILRYGSLPVAFEISAVSKVSGTLGADSLQSGMIAGLVGLALVAVVLLGVYRSLGVVGMIGLSVFGALLITIFGLLGAAIGLTITLAGVTGLIVSVGITADSYIVYYERIKEKIRQGYEVDEAVSEGFKAAFRTILTADTVTLLSAGVLGALAIGAVKGFAISLGIATILDIFIARTYTRRAVAVLAGTRFGDGGWFSIAGAAK